MSRNTLYLVVGGLAVAVVVIGFMLYREQHQAGIEVKVNDGGISVQTN